jgi:hypothetical protein
MRQRPRRRVHDGGTWSDLGLVIGAAVPIAGSRKASPEAPSSLSRAA